MSEKRTTERPRYNTRRAARLVEAPLQIITVTTKHRSERQLEPLAAISVVAQTKFLEGVGVVTTASGVRLGHRGNTQLRTPPQTNNQEPIHADGQTSIVISLAGGFSLT